MKYDFDHAADRANCGLSKYEGRPQRLKELGVLAYTGAEMDFKTAPVIMEALAARALGGIYGNTIGYDSAYLDCIVRWMKRRRSWEIRPEWITLSMGIVHAVSIAVRAFTREGEGVIIQPPVFNSFAATVKNNHRKLLENTLIYKNGAYQTDFDQLEKLMSLPEARLFILCNPHNPVTRVWRRDELEKMADMAQRHGVLIVADEIYSELAMDGSYVHPLSTIPAAFDNCLVCTSIGKTFNFVGTKHANIVIPNSALREKFLKQTQMENTSSLSPFMYTAVIAAYSERGESWVDELVEYGQENVRMFREYFAEHFPMLTVCDHDAGLLVWVDWHEWGMPEARLMEFLNNDCAFAVNAGSIYGEAGEGFTRIAIGTPRSGLTEALERLRTGAQKCGFIK